MILKRQSKLQLINNKPLNIAQSNKQNYYEQEDIKKLFQPPYREVFQLSYLYSSPLCSYYPPFVEMIKMLQNFNTETVTTDSFKAKDRNQLKILCMRFIYRQMLTIAVMDKNQILQNDYATKLKKWYYDLSEKHSFLQGIHFKKKKADDDKLEELIRKSYTSNVFDEQHISKYRINDYMRKRLSYDEKIFQRTFQKENFNFQRRKHTDQSEFLKPFLDIQLYKRQQQLLRNYRQKQVQSKYFKDIKINKNKMRQASLNNIKNRQFKNNFGTIDPKMTINNLISPFHRTFGDLRNDRINKSSKSLIDGLEMPDHLDWRKKSSEIQGMIEQKRSKNKLSLININGINLINSKIE